MSAQRRKCVGGNWKMNGSLDLVKTLVEGALNSAQIPDNTEVVIAPPFPYLADAKRVAAPQIQVSAQNIYDKVSGAYTGEVSAAFLKDLGINWVILGHSERREYFHETDEIVGKKVAFALGQGLKVIACIGEKLEEREKGITNEVCFRQLAAIEKEIQGNWKDIVIAYEPVWAIGTGKVATPEQAQEVHSNIRKWLADNVSAEVAAATRIQYGGSVNEKNCKDLSKQPDIDGFLVGGACLKPEFVTICQAWA